MLMWIPVLSDFPPIVNRSDFWVPRGEGGIRKSPGKRCEGDAKICFINFSQDPFSSSLPVMVCLVVAAVVELSNVVRCVCVRMRMVLMWWRGMLSLFSAMVISPATPWQAIADVLR